VAMAADTTGAIITRAEQQKRRTLGSG